MAVSLYPNPHHSLSTPLQQDGSSCTTDIDTIFQDVDWGAMSLNHTLLRAQYESYLCHVVDGLTRLNQGQSPTPALSHYHTSQCSDHHHHYTSTNSPFANPDPFTLKLLPPNDTRIYGGQIPIWLGVVVSPHVPQMMKDMYMNSCTVHLSIDGLPQWEAPLSTVLCEEDTKFESLAPSLMAQVRWWYSWIKRQIDDKCGRKSTS